ncbi:NUDIX domain-containing protein [Actinoalloteichus caeruleus]|uniref:NUDIX domain-containing protein n=1 Tax=Actinoalloteichus cyanogriseus TaxID=2893586 RepID=UPI003AAAF702
MVRLRWYRAAPPPDLPVRQVHGFLFAPDGRAFLRVDGARHGLPGGKRELEDAGPAATLRRETWEEVTLEIGAPRYLGYQLVVDGGTHRYAQVRMVALITRIHPVAPDLDNGRTYRRLLVDPRRVGDLLGWGRRGSRQAAAARQRAVVEFALPTLDLPPDGEV